jgi:hypothetical protein
VPWFGVFHFNVFVDFLDRVEGIPAQVSRPKGDAVLGLEFQDFEFSHLAV